MPTHSHMMFERYSARLASKGVTQHTFLNYRRMAERFCAHCEVEGIDPPVITEEELQGYFDVMPYALNTKRHHKAHLGGAFRYAHRKGWISADPFIDLVLPQKGTHIPHTVSNAELRTVKKAVPDDRAYLLFCLLAYTGMRRIEVCRLEWSDVNLKTNLMLANGKQNKQRYVPIHPVLHDALETAPYRLGHHVYPGRRGDQMVSSRFEYQWARTTKPSGAYTLQIALCNSSISTLR